MGVLSNKTVLVTGAARGIGRATSEVLAREGARLFLSDSGGDPSGVGLDPSVLESLAAELRKRHGAEVHTDCRDLSAPHATETLVATALEVLGSLNGVIASAGVLLDRPAYRTDEESLDRMLGIHVRHVLALLGAAAPSMIERKEGAFAFCAGPAAFFGLRGHAAEGAAQAAVIGAMRSAALELRKHDVRVNAVVPSARTRLTEALPLYRSIDADSMAPEHVAVTLAYLISPDAADVTGETIGVAGPRTYTFRIRESPGAFGEGKQASDVTTAGARLREALKG